MHTLYVPKMKFSTSAMHFPCDCLCWVWCGKMHSMHFIYECVQCMYVCVCVFQPLNGMYSIRKRSMTPNILTFSHCVLTANEAQFFSFVRLAWPPKRHIYTRTRTHAHSHENGNGKKLRDEPSILGGTRTYIHIFLYTSRTDNACKILNMLSRKWNEKKTDMNVLENPSNNNIKCSENMLRKICSRYQGIWTIIN